ncbi:MAG: class I SAM-dependent methyltransferase [bacterium]|nr:class I SAM-dependent methyltransferase [bacterium]
MQKSTVEEIRNRFDNDVERFSNLETGQTTTVDSEIVIDMISNSISIQYKNPKRICDIGCGAGNFTLRVLNKFPQLNCTIIDLSQPMLKKAKNRIEKINGKIENIVKDDIRNIILIKNHYDICIAAAVLHHLRNRKEWHSVLKKIYDSLVDGGSFWFWDLIKHDIEQVNHIQLNRYKKYLTKLNSEEYQKSVFAYIEKEDTPESVTFITQTMHEIGFSKVDIIHKNCMFAAITGIK